VTPAPARRRRCSPWWRRARRDERIRPATGATARPQRAVEVHVGRRRGGPAPSIALTGESNMTFTTEQHPGVCATPPPATGGFVFNHSMLRVKDPAIALDFYTRVLGMRVLRKLDFPEMKFSLYFLAHATASDAVPEDRGERTAWTFSQRAVLELTHNWGTESDPAFRYHDGNAQPQGFGHICISVPDLDAAVAWLDANQVTFVKRPDQGRMKDVAFVKDPDGYWIEIIEAARLKALGSNPPA
jgi:lactoylglutathione lyase